MRKKSYSTKLFNHFHDRERVTSEELFAFWQKEQPDLKPATFRWRLHELRNRGLLSGIGRGLYTFQSSPTRKFVPDVSIARMKPLATQIKKRFPYLKFCFWTTHWINQFMVHQPAASIVLLEVEADAENSILSFLQERDRFALIEPSPLEIERYILGNKEYPIVLKPLIHDAPVTYASEVPVPKLEKILVDLYVDKELFLPFQGKELVNIYKNVVEQFDLNITTLLAYASRRGKRSEIKQYFQDTAGINLNDKR